ncbi:MAG TPA: protein kinase [Polyangiaceae bacterium]
MIRFGGYLLLETLGRGGFGVVFLAQHIESGQFVALKQMRGGAQATPEERRAFVESATRAAAFEHPGIARVREVGEIEGCPYFTMDLFTGDLAAALELGQPTQAQAARWMHDIALAVHHAHSCEVLHHDLKPANILLDEAGATFVSDFGSAKRLSHQGECLESGDGAVGFYMAPEQITVDARAMTRRADIYSLGVILYELLTGQVPYEQLAFADWIAELVSPHPVRPPNELEPELNRDLQLICLKCLEKEPNRRYESAKLLAEDLDHVLHGWHPPHARPERALSRAVRWARRHPLRSALIAGATLLGLTMVVTALSLLQAEREQELSALQTNAFIANGQAAALLYQLRDFADRAERCGKRPGVRKLLLTGVINQDSSALESCARGFQAVYVAAPDGRLLAQWPTPTAPILGKNYAFRGYFRGASELAARALSDAYLGPAYLAESSGSLQFAFAVPVLGSDAEWLGSVIAGLSVDSTIGQISMQDSPQSGRIVALLGPRDKDRSTPESHPVKDFDFIVHPKLGRGREVALHDPSRASLDRAFGLAVTAGEQFSLRWTPPVLLPDYHDPLFDAASSFLAAFAPVGRTGYVVVVQTSKDAVRRDGRSLAKKLAFRAGVPLGIGLLVLGIAATSTVRRRRSLETRPRRKK